jgi:transcriptional regulator with XRE-family HTH domain
MNKLSKLSNAQVEEARALELKGWSQRRMARHFGVTQSTMNSYLKRSRDCPSLPSVQKAENNLAERLVN